MTWPGGHLWPTSWDPCFTMFCIYNNVNREIAKCLIFSRVTTFLIRYTVQLNLLFKVHQIHLKRQDKLKEKRHYLALALRALEIVINFILWNTSIRIGVVYSRMTAYMSHRGSLSVLMDIKKLCESYALVSTITSYILMGRPIPSFRPYMGKCLLKEWCFFF